MREQDWRTLLSNLQQRNCVLLLGPEVFDDDPAGESAPLTRRLAALLTEGLDPGSVTVGADLSAVAQQYAMRNGRSDLQSRIAEFYEEHRHDTSEIHKQLADVPFYLTITSCHDSLFENALREAGKKPQTGSYDFRGEYSDLQSIGTVDEPVIYHLNGTINTPESLVLTENDLLDFLVAVVSKQPPLANLLRHEIQKRGKSFLFVGFGIHHWYLRILLHVLKFNQLETRSFALETLNAPPGDLEQSILFYRTGYRIEIFRTEIREFVNELARRCKSQGLDRHVAAGAATLAGRAPRIFISHASEDAPCAGRVKTALKANGLDAWLDTENLEPGDDWDKTIEKRIHQSDYFVILNSVALQGKVFNYVNKEMKIAIDRQSYARSVRFITPVQIDDASLLDELSPYQALPLRSDEDLAVLASTIKRDFQRRGRQQ